MYDNPQHAVSLDPTENFVLNGEMPFTTSVDIANYIYAIGNSYSSYKTNYFGYERAACSVKLLEYLGYGNFENFISDTWSGAPLMADLNQNIFGLLAYQKIYSDFYRDSQWERISPSTFNVDYMDGNNMLVNNFNTNSSFVKIIISLISVIAIGRKICSMVFCRISNMVKLLLLRLLRM